ncbi:hypothetical protein H4W23_03310 [Streptomyces gardneri]|uniref:hypothetical protein n=1 Tax=Streptomyces gardneri TaxID=66892 RepID=UPI0006BD04B6|nr:hypothetical protein [Streptomyces gardneri]QPK43735.1 hypothetical protein H4W23_03310 [Streptomyces gardneri]WRK34990.1 hypothetical protein U0M97_03320 [Streptomyces venezuelae]CUM43471.1 hypothetical protein BN2537_15907 [Streptomyces venezuelae]
MTAQPGYTGPAGSVPPMRTLAELREALAAYGSPGDRKEFGAELGTVEVDDVTRVREITQAYRHRILLRRDANAAAASARTHDDVAAELCRTLNEAGAR